MHFEHQEHIVQFLKIAAEIPHTEAYNAVRLGVGVKYGLPLWEVRNAVLAQHHDHCLLFEFRSG
jgi:hypothetical protein